MRNLPIAGRGHTNILGLPLRLKARGFLLQEQFVNDIMVRKNETPDPRLKWATLSQAERDAAYDNNAAVKNSAALIAERNEASEDAARQPQILPRCALWRPRKDEDRPLSGRRQGGPLPGLPARRLLAAQFARPVCHAGRRRRSAWLVGCHSRILAGSRGIADGDRGGGIPGRSIGSPKTASPMASPVPSSSRAGRPAPS